MTQSGNTASRPFLTQGEKHDQFGSRKSYDAAWVFALLRRGVLPVTDAENEV